MTLGVNKLVNKNDNNNNNNNNNNKKQQQPLSTNKIFFKKIHFLLQYIP